MADAFQLPTQDGARTLPGMSEARALIEQRTRPLRRAEYDRMVEIGIFEGQRVELIRGRVVEMAPQYAPHASVIALVNEVLVPQVRGRARVRPQLPFVAVDESEPEPDLALVAIADHSREHPSQAFLLIEVSASSLAWDRAVKVPLYGESGVPEYWIVDVDGRRALVHRRPESGLYRDVSEVGADGVLEVEALPGVVVRLAEVLPGA